MPRRLVPSGVTGGSSFFCSIVWLFQNFVVSLQQIKVLLAISCRTYWDAEERSETFAPSTLETAVALKGDPSPGTTVSSALFGLLLLATRLGSCSVVRRWQCFFDSVLFGQDVGESARGAARWAVTPFFLCHHT